MGFKCKKYFLDEGDAAVKPKHVDSILLLREKQSHSGCVQYQHNVAQIVHDLMTDA